MRWLLFDTHPIQYRSPLFQHLARQNPGFKVCFFNSRFNSKKWWFREFGKSPRQNWELPLTENYPNTVLHTERLGWIGMLKAIYAVLREEQPSSVAVLGYYLPEHWAVRALCGWLRIPLVFLGETFDNGPPSLRQSIKRPLRRWFFSGVHRFVSIGNKNTTYYQSLGISDDRLSAGKYCVDSSFFTLSAAQASHERQAWRAKLGIAQDGFTILFVGRMFDRKRPEMLIEIHRRLVKDTRVHTVLVGNGPLEQVLRSKGETLPRLYFTGFQNQTQTKQAYYGADVLLVPSEFETWGLVVNEAAACGLPSIVTDTCGVAGDLVVNGKTGFVFPSGDFEKALQCVERMKNDRELYAQLCKEVRALSTQEFTLAQLSEAFIRAFKASGDWVDPFASMQSHCP